MTDDMKPQKSPQGTVPRAEADLISVATQVVKSWKEHPELTMIWTTPDHLQESTAMFAESFTVRNKLKSTRMVITQDLRAVNKEINDSIKYVKSYISEKYTAGNAPTYYPQFGIIKIRNAYKIPADNDNRLHSLAQMVTALGEHGLDDRKYGKPYWEDIQERFIEAKEKANDSDSASSGHVNIKSEQKVVIRKILNALISLLKANYPDNWKSELRVWGFQKEKY